MILAAKASAASAKHERKLSQLHFAAAIREKRNSGAIEHNTHLPITDARRENAVVRLAVLHMQIRRVNTKNESDALMRGRKCDCVNIIDALWLFLHIAYTQNTRANPQSRKSINNPRVSELEARRDSIFLYSSETECLPFTNCTR